MPHIPSTAATFETPRESEAMLAGRAVAQA